MRDPFVTNHCVDYTRVSSKEQVSNLSLATQRDRCAEVTRARGWQVAAVSSSRKASPRRRPTGTSSAGCSTNLIDPTYTDSIRELRVEERADKDGRSVRRTTIRIADPVPALQALARVKGWKKEDPLEGARYEAWVAVLRELPDEQFQAVYLRLIADAGAR